MNPPDTNRGVPDGVPPSESFTAFLDWLRFSIPDWLGFQSWLARAAVIAGCERAVHPVVRENALTPLPHYNSALEYETFRVDWHTERPSQKILVTFSGSGLSEWRARGGDDLSLLKSVLAGATVRITRLDFAIDILNTEIQPEDIYNAYNERRCVSPAKTATFVESKTAGARDGKTVYVGSRASGRVVRIYDKAAEQGEVEGNWLRIELEAKAPMASAIAEAMVRHGIAPAGRKALAEFLDCEVEWYKQAVSGNVDFDIPQPGRKATDFSRWAMNFLLPQVNKALRVVPGFREAILELIEMSARSAKHGP